MVPALEQEGWRRVWLKGVAIVDDVGSGLNTFANANSMCRCVRKFLSARALLRNKYSKQLARRIRATQPF